MVVSKVPVRVHVGITGRQFKFLRDHEVAALHVEPLADLFAMTRLSVSHGEKVFALERETLPFEGGVGPVHVKVDVFVQLEWLGSRD